MAAVADFHHINRRMGHVSSALGSQHVQPPDVNCTVGFNGGQEGGYLPLPDMDGKLVPVTDGGQGPKFLPIPDMNGKPIPIAPDQQLQYLPIPDMNGKLIPVTQR